PNRLRRPAGQPQSASVEAWTSEPPSGLYTAVQRFETIMRPRTRPRVERECRAFFLHAALTASCSHTVRSHDLSETLGKHRFPCAPTRRLLRDPGSIVTKVLRGGHKKSAAAWTARSEEHTSEL